MYCKHICRIHSLQWNLWGKEIVFCHFCLVFFVSMRLTGIAGPQPGIKPVCLAVKARAELRSPIHWTTREPLCFGRSLDMYYQFALPRFCKFFSLYSVVYVGLSQSLDA